MFGGTRKRGRLAAVAAVVAVGCLAAATAAFAGSNGFGRGGGFGNNGFGGNGFGHGGGGNGGFWQPPQGAFGRWAPPRPAQDTPSTAGLSSPLFTSHTFRPTVRTAGTAQTSKATTSSTPTIGGAAPGAVGASTLVLYDTTNTFGWLGELYATYAGNLASHFGTWKAEPVAQYQAGQISQYTATIYIGSTYDEPLPLAFLDDVYNATRPVVWIYDNIWELTSRYPDFQSKYGWMWWQFDTSPISHVVYKGVTLNRDATDNGAGIMEYGSLDTTKATVLGSAVRDSDGSQFPWAIRSGMLTYVGENPFVYTSETDRVLAFDDLLYDVLDPSAQTQHRALVRLEDISPKTDPNDLKAITDYLYSQHIPFGFGVSPVYLDPTGYYSNGTPETIHLSSRGNAVASMIRYMQARGGTLVMHGYTHQYQNVPNPYTGVTDDDFEFFRVTENADHTLNFQGPVPEDSPSWATSRIDNSFAEFRNARVTAPTIFEFPHYTASAVDYAAVAQQFKTRWERSLYFGGVLAGGTIDYSHQIGEFFPYVVRDVYGTTVLPENLGDYEPEPFYQFPVHTVDDVLAAAQAESVVRDGIAGFYFHTFWGTGPLQQIVDGLRAQGWTFTSPTQVATNG